MEQQPDQTARNTETRPSASSPHLFGMGAWADEYPKRPYKLQMGGEKCLSEGDQCSLQAKGGEKGLPQNDMTNQAFNGHEGGQDRKG